MTKTLGAFLSPTRAKALAVSRIGFAQSAEKPSRLTCAPWPAEPEADSSGLFNFGSQLSAARLAGSQLADRPAPSSGGAEQKGAKRAQQVVAHNGRLRDGRISIIIAPARSRADKNTRPGSCARARAPDPQRQSGHARAGRSPKLVSGQVNSSSGQVSRSRGKHFFGPVRTRNALDSARALPGHPGIRCRPLAQARPAGARRNARPEQGILARCPRPAKQSARRALKTKLSIWHPGCKHVPSVFGALGPERLPRRCAR